MAAGVLTSVINATTAVVTGAVLYLLPGYLFLRRNQLTAVERLVLSVGLSVGLSTCLLTTLGLIVGLSVVPLVLGASVLVITASRFPLPPGSLESAPSPWTAFVPAALFLAVAAIQAQRPALFTLFDAQALWAPLADGIARSGSLTPDWVPTILKGFPPGVALVAGAVSVPSGHLNERAALLVPPVFGALTVLVTLLLAGRFRVSGARSMALAVVVATPLLARAIVFHDDLIIAFLVATTLYFGLAASSWHGWIATGIVAGGALSVKPLGVVALALVAVLLWSRRPSWRSGIAAACGFGVAVPWYLGNLVRLGDPVYPFLSTGTDNALRLIVEDHASYLANRNGDQLELLGSLALALLSVGLAVGLVYLLRRDRRLALGLVLLLAVYLVAWGRFDYGTRHLLVLYPVYASVAGLGLAVVPRLFVRRFAAATFVAVAAVWSLVVGVSVWNVYVERWGRTPFEERTGLYAMALGKWYGEQTLSAALDPPPDRQVFGEIGEFWSRLQHADPHARVLSFDTRAWYIPQRILSAGEDVEAVRIYLAGDADAQHAAILADGVRFVLARKAVDSKHRILYKLGPWRDLDRRPDLYRLLFRNRLGSLYEVLPG